MCFMPSETKEDRGEYVIHLHLANTWEDYNRIQTMLKNEPGTLEYLARGLEKEYRGRRVGGFSFSYKRLLSYLKSEWEAILEDRNYEAAQPVLPRPVSPGWERACGPAPEPCRPTMGR
jgi:hypothetical protein